MKTIPSFNKDGRVSALLRAEGNGFVSKEVEQLELTYGGIKGDFHEGLTRLSGGREPWYNRGTPMRNERQLSIVCQTELDEVAQEMGIEKIESGWIGANLVFEGLDRLSYLPSRTLIMFEKGVTLRIDGFNGPCRYAGGEIARHNGCESEDPSRAQLALDFVKAAQMKRGLVAWVEREGTITKGEKFTAHIWPQTLYK